MAQQKAPTTILMARERAFSQSSGAVVSFIAKEDDDDDGEEIRIITIIIADGISRERLHVPGVISGWSGQHLYVGRL